MFSDFAAKLAGITAALLGWRPSEFWASTPAELASIIAALTPETGTPADTNLLSQLQEQFPDG